MSNQVNDELFERASEAMTYWEGTIIAKAIEHDLDVMDLDALYAHVCEAEATASQEEFEAANVA